MERVLGPLPRQVLVDYLYWGGPMDSAERAVTDIEARVGDDPGAVAWEGGGPDLCILEISRLRSGDLSQTSQTISRLRAGSDDPRGKCAVCLVAGSDVGKRK